MELLGRQSGPSFWRAASWNISDGMLSKLEIICKVVKVTRIILFEISLEFWVGWWGLRMCGWVCMQVEFECGESIRQAVS